MDCLKTLNYRIIRLIKGIIIFKQEIYRYLNLFIDLILVIKNDFLAMWIKAAYSLEYIESRIDIINLSITIVQM